MNAFKVSQAMLYIVFIQLLFITNKQNVAKTDGIAYTIV
jgi:hypothetical protein